MTRRRSRAVAQVAVVVCVAGALVLGSSPSRPLPNGTLAAVAVEVRQARSDWADRVVQVRVTSASERDLTVRGARLDSSLFEGPAEVGEELGVLAGAGREVSIALGAARCGGSGGGARVTLRVADDGGRSGTVVVEPSDPNGHLERIHGEDCAAAAVAAGARLGFGAALQTREVGSTLVGTVELLVVPVPGGPEVEITRIEGTVLLQPPREGEVGWTPVVGSGGPEAIELDLVPTRCDPHAVAEDKRGTFFGVHASVDGEPQAVFYVPAGDSLRAELRAFVGKYCTWGEDAGR